MDLQEKNPLTQTKFREKLIQSFDKVFNNNNKINNKLIMFIKMLF